MAVELRLLVGLSWLPGNAEYKRVFAFGDAEGQYGFSFSVRSAQSLDQLGRRGVGMV